MTSNSTSSEPRGRRLLPDLIDEIGRKDPERIWASVPLSSKVQDGFCDISFSQLARAIDFMARWIESYMGSGSNFETVVYYGEKDVRYFIIPLALVKTGYKMLAMSARYGLDDQVSLMHQTNCTTILHSNSLDVTSIAIRSDSQVYRVPSLEEMLSVKRIEPYPYMKTFEEASAEPILTLSTSATTSSTGKPIVYTHAMYATIDAQSIPSALHGRENICTSMQQCQRHFSAMPMAHGSSFARFLRAILLEVTLVLADGRSIGEDQASVTYVKELLKHGKVNAAHFLPRTLRALCRDPETLAQLSKLDLIGWGGAPLPQDIGDLLVQNCPNTTFFNSLGSQEGGAYVTYRTDPEDWEYVCFCPHYNGIKWVEHGDGLYELTVVRDPKLQMFQGCFTTMPRHNEWSSRDLFSKHPFKPHHWRYEGRVDDLIVGPDGSKFNPVPLQTKLEEHPAVRTALMIEGHTSPTLLIELNEPKVTYARWEEIVEELWPGIEASNRKVVVCCGKVKRSSILVASPEKPFPRSEKGSVQKMKLHEFFKEELNIL